MTTTTAAEQIAHTYHDDGQRLEVDGVNIGDACLAAGARAHNGSDAGRSGMTAYEWGDGSAIVLVGRNWDLRSDTCECGFCWAGADQDCPAAE